MAKTQNLIGKMRKPVSLFVSIYGIKTQNLIGKMRKPKIIKNKGKDIYIRKTLNSNYQNRNQNQNFHYEMKL